MKKPTSRRFTFTYRGFSRGMNFNNMHQHSRIKEIHLYYITGLRNTRAFAPSSYNQRHYLMVPYTQVIFTCSWVKDILEYACQCRHGETLSCDMICDMKSVIRTHQFKFFEYLTKNKSDRI